MHARIALIITMSVALAGCQVGDADLNGARADQATAPPDSASEAVPSDENPSPASTGCDAGVWEGDYVVATQADLDALAGYTEVTGDLRIEDSDIVHLSGPGCLTAVGEGLVVYDNFYLESLSGFDNLRTIGDRLVVVENSRLATLDGFGELRSAGRVAFINNDLELVIHGFDELRTVTGDVKFENGHYQVFGFDELELIEGTLRIWNGNGPDGKNITIHGMNELSTVGSIQVEYMGHVALDGLVDLERVNGSVVFDNCVTVDTRGLRDLSRIDGDLLFDYDDYIAGSFIDFPDLEHIGGHFVIESGEIELGAFNELEFIGGDLRFDETNIPEIVGFDDLEVVGGTFMLHECPRDRLVGFNDLKEVGGDLILNEIEDSVLELAIFDELESIGGMLELRNNELVSFSMFDDLRSIGGDLLIHNNEVQSLGFPDIEVLGGAVLDIRWNEPLPTCEAEALLARLQANGFAGSAIIDANGPCQ